MKSPKLGYSRKKTGRGGIDNMEFPSKVPYRDWGKSDNGAFRTKLREALGRVESHDYKSFEQTFLSLLNFHAPMKSKKQHVNHKSYMTIMK